MTQNKNIGVFLSAREDVPQSYIDATKEFGTRIGKEGRTLIYGGSRTGLMEVIAKSVKEAGGKVIGIAPEIIYRQHLMSEQVDVEIPVANMADRKQIMIERSDIIVALPGGIGTIDEIFSTLSMRSIGYKAPEIILFNVDHCWDSLINMLEDFYARHVMPLPTDKVLHIATNIEDVMKIID